MQAKHQLQTQIRSSTLKMMARTIAFCLAFAGLVFPAFAADRDLNVANRAKIIHTVGYIKYPQPNYGEGDHRKLVERGEYLVKAADCISCHTDTRHDGASFAGGYGIRTPFGIIYAPNITPDKETGIGNWTDENFIRAMHEGIAPDGSNYFPVFPYTSFTRVTKDDVLAIRAYLSSVPAVHKFNRENEMIWPFNYRFLQLGWKLMYFDFTQKGTYQYDPNHTPQWNQGAYLVQGLGHCGECHTPRNLAGAMKNKYYLTGAFVDGFFAPNITSYGLADTSVPEVVDVFTKEEMLKGAGRVEGPMEEVDHNSLQKLTPEDLNNIVIYLQTVKSYVPKAATDTRPLTIEEGKDVYETYCVTCHATGGAGAPISGNLTAWTPRLKQPMDTIYKHAINGYNSMPPKGTCISCSDNEIKGAVDYMVSISKPGAASNIKVPTPTVRLGVEEGKKIYEAQCASCHDSGKDGAPKFGDKEVWNRLLAKNMDTLITNTIRGYKTMPARGGCEHCTNAELIAALKYIVDNSNTKGNYLLW